jgi:hypothetical protein
VGGTVGSSLLASTTALAGGATCGRAVPRRAHAVLGRVSAVSPLACGRAVRRLEPAGRGVACRLLGGDCSSSCLFFNIRQEHCPIQEEEVIIQSTHANNICYQHYTTSTNWERSQKKPVTNVAPHRGLLQS